LVGPIRAIVRIDKSRCDRCMLCVELCPCSALAYTGQEIVFDSSKCIACMGCKVVCPRGAIDVEIDRRSYEVLELSRATDRKLDEYSK